VKNKHILSGTLIPLFYFFSAVVCLFFYDELSLKIYYEEYSDAKYFLFISASVYCFSFAVLFRALFVYSPTTYCKLIPFFILIQLLQTILSCYIFYFYFSETLLFTIFLHISILILYAYEFKNFKQEIY
jgi:hypothetical protein